MNSVVSEVVGHCYGSTGLGIQSKGLSDLHYQNLGPLGRSSPDFWGWSESTLTPLLTVNINRFCWDRLLLQEVASTRGTGAWDVLVLDEAQERSVASDLLQGLLRDARLGNLPDDPRVVVVTDPAFEPKLQAFWGDPPIVHVPRGPGRCPTPIYRDTVPTDRVKAACQAVLELCRKEAPGDVLVYLPSEEVNRLPKEVPLMPPSCPGEWEGCLLGTLKFEYSLSVGVPRENSWISG